MFISLPFMYLFICTMFFGTLFSVSSVHWLSVWAGLEINLIGFLPMLMHQKNISESESAMKYFVVQALGSSLLVFGSLMIFSISFSWEIYVMSSYYKIGLYILLGGLCIKLGIFPFHFWLPGVMAGLSWLSCILLATWQKLAPLFLLLCIFELNKTQLMFYFLGVVSVGSSITGGLGGMNQTQIRALLAYSSIGHLGWMMYASIHGEWALKTYLSIYVLISFSLFLSLWLNNLMNSKVINNLKDSKLMYVNIIVILLSLGGLPPLLGFISKWVVIQISSMNNMLFMVLFLILGSLLSLYYYLNLLFSILLTNNKSILWKQSVNNSVIFIVMVNAFGGILILFTGFLSAF
uniref:NADH-ubiquinone oxidoreductase chain 2 n=1 Tax=Pygmaeconus traillii TaxID=1917173 RepID=A0A1L3N1Z1_9COND|nr:NADH dehydrogenase subunit 2 [Pygmaeconus traillii]